jgi:5-formyltetrahydrofolate cyclo-ligase
MHDPGARSARATAPPSATTKEVLRREFSAARAALSPDALEAARTAVREAVLARAAAAGWRRVAAYVPFRSEPGSLPLLAALRERGVEVLVPITLPDRDLDWAVWAPDGQGPALGPDAVRAVDVMLVPALAVADDGTRLGRGGGSYDRALARIRAGTPVAALLHAGERVSTLPRAEWDVPVSDAVSPTGWERLAGGPGLANRD